MPERDWFSAKRHGYGAVPTSWQGWTWALGAAAFVGGAVATGTMAQLQGWPTRRLVEWACAAVAIGAIGALFAVAHARTGGGLRWR